MYLNATQVGAGGPAMRIFTNSFVFFPIVAISSVLNESDDGRTSSSSQATTKPQQLSQAAISAYNRSLSTNISYILNTLLQNYNRHFRPNFPGPPVVVTVDISVRSMGPISEKDMEFQLDCYFRQMWVDKRLQFAGPLEELSLNAIQFMKQIWKPDTYIKNGRDSYLHKITVPNRLLRLKQNGEIKVSQRLTLKTRCQMFLRKFPMDTQACPLLIGSLAYNSEDVIYKWVRVEVSDDVKLSQYMLNKIFVNAYNISTVRRSVRGDISVLAAHFKLVRQQGYYIIQIYMPTVMIVALSWVSFWINKESSNARVPLGVMAVLTMTTLGLSIRNELPRVSYSTALDTYIMVSFAFVFAALVEYAVINFTHFLYIKKALKELRKAQALAQMRQLTSAMIGAPRSSSEPPTQVAVNVGSSPPANEQHENADGDEAEEQTELYHSLVDAQKAFPGLKRRQYRRPAQILRESYANVRKRLRGEKVEKKPRGLASMMQMMAPIGPKKGEKKEEEGDEQDQDKTVDWIDTLSKFIFPCAYLGFNGFYWTSFLYWIPDEIDSLPGLISEDQP